MQTFRARLLWLVGFTGLLLACGDGPTGPGIQPQVINTTDNFQYQVSNVQDYTGTLSYTWQNTGVQATINQSTTVPSGSISLVVLDANGTEVYSRSLADNGTFTTAAGVAGAWTIRIVYNSADATVNFRADKTT